MKDPNVISGNGFEFTYIDGHEFIWKALPVQKLHTAEKPQISAVVEIEKQYQKLYDKQLAHLVKSISRYLV